MPHFHVETLASHGMIVRRFLPFGIVYNHVIRCAGGCELWTKIKSMAFNTKDIGNVYVIGWCDFNVNIG